MNSRNEQFLQTMTSLSRHLLTFLFIICIIYSSINGNSAQPPTKLCPPFDCGNGVSIRYPFWLQNQQLDHCGYPGLNLSCHGRNPVINLANDLYQIRSISYLDNSLIVSYTELTDQADDCPRILRDFTVILTNSSVFNYTRGNKMMRFFYNCTLYPPSLPDITCLQFGAKRSFMFTTGAIPEFDWHRYCESTVVVPVLQKAIDDAELLVNSSGRALVEAFELTWRPPAGACEVCEASLSNGFCGHGNDTRENFFCICPDGRHSTCCNCEGAVSVSEHLNLVGLGAIILGGLMIVATVFNFTRWNKFILYKPVSHE